ncbi:Dos2-interacting transcription regulator of RNA-Pol-II-domain-containing protein [Pilobolus umbonatus]|nr:Dos2-interacting transcription regulator of RNA-Pol-II-domain-containing protein [Pilobolus umbonatus]
MVQVEKEVIKYMITTDPASLEAIESLKTIITDINTGSVQANLLQLIQILGQYLTSEDEFVRTKATGLLSKTLNECQHEAINNKAVSVLVDFYSDRLSDKACVHSLLEGLVGLTSYTQFTGINAVTLSKKLFESTEVHQYPHGTRYLVYQIFGQLINRHAAALKSINNEFIYGFTKILDGEKDPRNLLEAFNIVKAIVDNFDISAHIEDIFEVTFCYFPITFKPPPDDPYGITAEDLKLSLRSCLASSPHFAKFALPLILEKLSSTSGSAKKDSMETLATCAPVYGATALLPNIKEIFNYLKLEVFHAADASLEDAAISAIHSVVGALNTGITNSNDESNEKAILPLIEECVTNLKDPDMKDYKQTGRIIEAIASASDPACQLVVDMIAPLVLKQYRETNMASLQKSNMDIINELLEACKDLYGSTDGKEVDTDFTSPLIQYKDRFLGIFQSSLMASNEYNLLRLSAIRGLTLLVLSRDYLKPNEVGIVVQSLNTILLDEEDIELCNAALNAIHTASLIHSQYILDLTLPSLINRLPDSSALTSPSKYLPLLYAFKVLSPVSTIYKNSLFLLMDKFKAVCLKDNEYPYALSIIQTIADIVKYRPVDINFKEINTIVLPLFSFIIQSSLNESTPQLILNENILSVICLITFSISAELNSSEQKEFVDKTFKLFMHGEMSVLDIASRVPFKPTHISSSQEQKKSFQLFSAVICSLRKDVVLPLSNTEDYLNELVTLALTTDNHIQMVSTARMIGSIINKWKDNTALNEYVTYTRLVLEDSISKSSSNSEHAVEIYLWIIKSLVLRGNALGYEMTNKVIDWCGTDILGTLIPEGFNILMGDDDIALNKESHATISILYKQRFFNYCLPKLVNGFHGSQNTLFLAVRSHYLIALSYLLKNVPKTILLNELSEVMQSIGSSIPLNLPSLLLADSPSGPIT